MEGEKAVLSEKVALPPLGSGKLLVKNKAVSLNPTDWKHVAYKIAPKGSIIGCDVAGEIVKLGPDVTDFSVGEIVYGIVHGGSVKHPENGGFAEYSVLDSKLTMRTPEGIKLSGKTHISEGPVTTIEAAATLPVSLFTAGSILDYHFGVKLEWEPSKVQNDYPLLIWGGGTGVAQILIQLAEKLNAYSKIVVVASKKHEKQLKEYGADELFDYHDKDVIEQIKAKYSHFPQLLDAVSSPESFKEIYKLAAGKLPSTLLQLTSMSEELINQEDRSSNVTVDGVLLYLVGGEDVPFGPYVFPANPIYRKSVIEFAKFIEPKIVAGEIHHIPVHVFDKGLEGIPELLEDVKNGKNRGEKYVSVLH